MVEIIIQENSSGFEFAEDWVTMSCRIDQLSGDCRNRIDWLLSENLVDCFLYYFAKVMFINVTTYLFWN
mgnify:CR=1|jgi:hypothetical protein